MKSFITSLESFTTSGDNSFSYWVSAVCVHFPILVWSAQEPLVITLFLSTCWLHLIEWAFEKIFFLQLNNKPDNLQRDVRQVPARLHNHSYTLLSQETSQVPATLKNQNFTPRRTFSIPVPSETATVAERCKRRWCPETWTREGRTTWLADISALVRHKVLQRVGKGGKLHVYHSINSFHHITTTTWASGDKSFVQDDKIWWHLFLSFQPAEHGELRGEPGYRGAKVDADWPLQDRTELWKD